MYKLLLFLLCCVQINFAQAQSLFIVNKDSTVFTLTEAGALHLATLPLKCLDVEYPNKTSHTSLSKENHILTPKELHPAFYGCFDWHSCVHGHWMLVKLLKQFPNLKEAGKIRTAIAKNITTSNIEAELQYFHSPIAKTWERTYGWAWLLKLQQELISFNDKDAIAWSKALQPLCDTIVNMWMQYLPKQTYPNRTGVHPNTAFGLVLALDYARAAKHKVFESAITKAAIDLFLKDSNAPALWEPNGTDFLSPALEEADLMRRILPQKEFIIWFNNFLPQKSLEHLLQLPEVSDRSDYQIVHLDGLHFSRSWCMKGIANALPKNDARKKLLQVGAIQHLAKSLPHIVSGNYGGEHWLASFAVYALTEQ
ncbi:MAG: DUF2891 domain-containing protein [Chitinophagaceae bacterium]|nr:DUF2891 domain-containing protein [Chitinophagaceae bacterium]MCW5905642.1 DUF2891 domain-containing protein [Chitinophagaceae bacterium]